MKIPILVIIFNRPEFAEQMLCALKEIKAEKIYISADGARENIEGEIKKCELTKKRFLDGITWPCKVSTNFKKENLGCKRGVVDAIDWFFKHEKYGNILEDDCIPNRCFFEFTEKLLKRYENEDRVWMISGDNSADIVLEDKNTYSFVRDPIIWGWATWRSTWNKYDIDMKQWREIRDGPNAKKIFINKDQYKQLSDDYDKCMKGEIDTWDYQLSAAMKINNGLCIIPRVNLIKNIGFGENATHTNEVTERSNKNTEEIGKILFNKEIKIDAKAEKQIMKKIQGIEGENKILKKIKATITEKIRWHN